MVLLNTGVGKDARPEHNEKGYHVPSESFSARLPQHFFNACNQLVLPCGGGIEVTLPTIVGLSPNLH